MRNRLTKKTNNGYVPQYERETKHNYYDLVSKLGRLEDIEEELGIDLITLFEALKNGVYWKGNCIFSSKSNGVYFEDRPKLDIENKLLRNLSQVNKDYVYFKDYGKTWALTKEELE